MHSFDEILTAYQRHVDLPWQSDVPPAGRIWIVWYDKSMQRRFTARLSEFEHATIKANHGWRQTNLDGLFGNWIANHEFFEGLMQQPRELKGLLPEFEDHVVEHLISELATCNSDDVLAVDGAGSLFGLVRISRLMERVERSISGRMLIGFPGTYQGGIYKLLDAREGWNYHAVPIPPANSI